MRAEDACSRVVVVFFFVHAVGTGTGNGTRTAWSIIIVFPVLQVSSVSGMQARTRLECTCNCRVGSYLEHLASWSNHGVIVTEDDLL